MKLAGWGNFPKVECRVLVARRTEEIARAVKSDAPLIARGNGRAYGDAALNENLTIDMRQMNRLIHFDSSEGILTVEAGILLSDILANFMPRGWSLPVTPGTADITCGGAIAADVHGKNHHCAGSFCDHVCDFTLIDGAGSMQVCSTTSNPDLFNATRGGHGLTGVIVTARLQLVRIETSYVVEETVPTNSLDETMKVFEESANTTYLVAWIDCLAKGEALGRALVQRGEMAKKTDLPPSKQKAAVSFERSKLPGLPLFLPTFVLNTWSIRAFNFFYYAFGKRKGRKIARASSFFYPLDAIPNWNRMYGRRGFVQFQCVLPLANSKSGVKEILEEVSTRGMGSFLAVLKLLGSQNGSMSFPMEGYTLALDFPANKRTFALFETLAEIVTKNEGRVYLAKDAMMKPEQYKQGYPGLDKFVAFREKNGADEIFTSKQSERLGL